MKLTQLSEAIISNKCQAKDADRPGIEMSKVLADLASKALPGEDATIQILPRQNEWASTVKINANGKSIDIDITATPTEAYAKVVIPGSVGTRPGVRQIKPREISRYDLMDPLSFEKSVNDAVKYLIS